MDKEDLILKNDRLVYYVLGKLGLYDKRDIYYDIGLFGLVKAANEFDPSKGYKFSTYAYFNIKTEILHHIKSEKCNKRRANYNTVSLDEPIGSDSEGKEIKVIDTIKSDVDIEEELIAKEQKEMLYKAISKLKEKERLILRYYYGLNGCEELKQNDICKKLNISQAHVSRIIKNSIKKIKNMIKEG